MKKSKSIRPEVKEIKIKSKVDEYPDLSYLGEFSDVAGKFAVQHSDVIRGAYKYFNAENVETQDQAIENYNRMMEYEKGNINHIGIMAECEILIPQGNKNFLIEHITSGGLWGIESDNDKEHIEEIKKEQLKELKDVLKTLGVKGIRSAKIIDEV